VNDAAGNAASSTRTVIVRPLGTDASLSALSISFGNLTPAFASSTFAYSALLPYDSVGIPSVAATTTDSNASYAITSSGGVTGTSTIAVTAEDASTTQSYTISYSVAPAPDTTAPVITILGDNPARFVVGTTYVDAGATSTDNIDGDLTSKIVASSSVNSSVIGTYSVVYSVSDAAGNKSTSTRSVIIYQPVPGQGSDSGSSGGGGGASGLIPSAPSGNVSGSSPAAPAGGANGGIVLGSSTGPAACSPYLKSYLKPGAKNDPAQVTFLQKFLNQFDGANLAITGIYDKATVEAVKAFQKRYSSRILGPWGIQSPTGVVSFTTLRVINEVYCGSEGQFPLTAAQLAEIARIKSLANGDSGEQRSPSYSNVPEATSTDNNQNETSSTAAPSSPAAGTSTPKQSGSWLGGIWSWFSGKK